VAGAGELAAIPIERWNYQWRRTAMSRILGPMAQNFKGAFYPGRDDKTSACWNWTAVGLAAFKG